jgi:capsular polysaccharide transport system permease protein
MDATLAVPRPPGKPWGQHTRVIFALLIREMGTRSSRAEGGYLWAILEPLGGILLLSIVFSAMLRTPPLGTSFILFYASGKIPYGLYQSMVKAIGGSVSSNRGLLTYPVVSVLDAVTAKFLLTLLTQLVVAVLLFTGIIGFLGLSVHLDVGDIVVGMLLAGALGLGVGTLNCVLVGLFPVWGRIWKVVNRPLMYLSAVLHLYEVVPPGLQGFFWYNPLVHIMGVMRAGFYAGAYHPTYISYPYVIGFALTTFTVGAYLLRRHAGALIDA